MHDKIAKNIEHDVEKSPTKNSDLTFNASMWQTSLERMHAALHLDNL